MIFYVVNVWVRQLVFAKMYIIISKACTFLTIQPNGMRFIVFLTLERAKIPVF